MLVTDLHAVSLLQDCARESAEQIICSQQQIAKQCNVACVVDVMQIAKSVLASYNFVESDEYYISTQNYILTYLTRYI